LARCSIDGEDLGAALVGAGLALARDGYRNEESAARSAGLGLWQGRFVDPRRWRDDGPSVDPGAGALESLWTWFRQLTGARTLR
jgi:endonuclease YncB( thermonuclease family)